MPSEMPGQLDILGGEVAPAVRPPSPRRTERWADPGTSSGPALIRRTETRVAVLRAFGAIGGLTDRELAARLGCGVRAAGKQRFGAQEAGLVEDWMDRGSCLTRAGARVHRLSAAGVGLLGEWEATP